MTDRAQEVLREALTLPVDQRADVAAELLASLDDAPAMIDPAAIEAAWGREIERRARRVMAGESVGEPWEDVRERVARRLAER
jgi:putative addiction module component (TIGR02574 family)